MKSIAALALLVFFAMPCVASPKPDNPKPNRRVFIFGTSLLAASTAADAYSTANAISRGGFENNLVLGKHPSNARISGLMGAAFLGQSAAFYFTEHNRHAWVRWAGRAYIGFIIEEHIRLSACNAKLNWNSPTGSVCRPLVPF